MRPTIGRVVMYTNLGDAQGKYPPEQQMADITKVRVKPGLEREDPQLYTEGDFMVSLKVTYETGEFYLVAGSAAFPNGVPFSPEFKPGHWSWPPRV